MKVIAKKKSEVVVADVLSGWMLVVAEIFFVADGCVVRTIVKEVWQ